MKLTRNILLLILLTPLASIAQETTTPVQSVDQLLYAIPVIIILAVIYTMRSARKKMITLGITNLKIMTLIYLLSGTTKDPGENLKKFKKSKKGKIISGEF
jgi:uncharacterized membrane protein (DUF441 family)